VRAPIAAKRRRRSPEQARDEIVAAAEAFLRERPFRELTVDEVMAHTGLSRPSFYVYFRDRHHLLLSLVEEIGGELFAMADRWLRGGSDPVADARAALEGVAVVYAEHGVALRAIAEAASGDPEVETMYRALVESFVDATSAHIADEVAAGRMRGVDPRETARALVWMNERYLVERLGTAPGAPVSSVVETLLTVWVRTLYERSP
jgi:AcrR family transcriptional regulator